MVGRVRRARDAKAVFGDFGIVAAKDGEPRGQAAIDVFDLNREALKDECNQQQVKAVSALKEALGKEVDERQKAVGTYLHVWIGPSAPCSRSVRAYVALRLAQTNCTL